jgi:hypothetical protein
MATKAKRAKRKPVNLDRIPVWTPRQASRWSGIRYRLFLRLLHAGMVPHITCATARPATSDHRIYLIPREPFQKWLNSIGPKGLTAATGEAVTITATGENAA